MDKLKQLISQSFIIWHQEHNFCRSTNNSNIVKHQVFLKTHGLLGTELGESHTVTVTVTLEICAFISPHGTYVEVET